MEYVLYVIMSIAILLGLISGVNYIIHPLAGTSFVSYSGKKFWLTAFVCLIALYLKG